ncbi:hypothetical protein ACFL59_02250 [Planctomycetota bacterium]
MCEKKKRLPESGRAEGKTREVLAGADLAFPHHGQEEPIGVDLRRPPLALVVAGARQPLLDGWRLEEDTGNGVRICRLIEQ